MCFTGGGCRLFFRPNIHKTRHVKVIFIVKIFSDALKLFFVTAGAVIGAGFLSGGELVIFFKSRELFYLFTAAAVFFVGFSLPAQSGGTVADLVFFAADAVFAAAMLSGLDEIVWASGFLKGFPIASLIAVIAFHFLFSKNVGRVERLNFALIPFSALIVVIALAFAKNAPVVPQFKAGAKGFSDALLYASVNVFVALPAVNVGAKNKPFAARILSAGLFAAFFAVFAYFILRVAPNSFLPVFDIARGTPVFPLLTVAAFTGSFTSFVCYAYPLKARLQKTAKDERQKRVRLILLYGAVFALSRLGLNAIIRYTYPLVGGAGLAFIVKNLFGIKSGRNGDTMVKRSALCQKRKKPKSKNLPKKNTAII